jgi:hypothetical protein
MQPFLFSKFATTNPWEIEVNFMGGFQLPHLKRNSLSQSTDFLNFLL